jgi:tripartite-type tricarboxylate transporter receptor subunit TctC
MNPFRRRFLHLAAGAAALSAATRFARAQTYPSHPIMMIVPLAAGGPTDTIGRILAEGMRASLGQAVVVENVTGAEGTIGVGRAARSPPDGYTLSIGQMATHVLNGAVYSLRYNLQNDLEPVAPLTTAPVFIVANNAVPAKDLRELIAWIRTNENKVSAGTFSVWARLFGISFQERTNTRFPLVPYRGAAPAMQDLIAGQTNLMFDQAANSLPQLRAGKIKAYAIAAKTRLPLAPEIATVDEAELPGFYASVWHGLWVPKGTPREVIAKLSSAVVNALADPRVRSRLTDLGQEIFPSEQQTPEALGMLQKAEIEKWWPIIRAAGIKGE